MLAAAQGRPQSASEQEKEALAEKEAVQHYFTCRQLVLKSMVDDVDELNASDTKRWLEASSKATEASQTTQPERRHVNKSASDHWMLCPTFESGVRESCR